MLEGKWDIRTNLCCFHAVHKLWHILNVMLYCKYVSSSLNTSILAKIVHLFMTTKLKTNYTLIFNHIFLDIVSKLLKYSKQDHFYCTFYCVLYIEKRKRPHLFCVLFDLFTPGYGKFNWRNRNLLFSFSNSFNAEHKYFLI